jgi:hypothetical protein
MGLSIPPTPSDIPESKKCYYCLKEVCCHRPNTIINIKKKNNVITK